MRPRTKSRLLFPRGATTAACLLAALAGLAVSSRSSLAADEFQQLVNQIPRSANAVVLLNMEKAKNSPLGLKENWKAKIESAFEAGLVRVPPQATRFVLASQFDFEFKEPLWEAAVIDLEDEFSMQQVAQVRRGTLDTIEGLPALARPNDTYLVQLGPKTLGAMGPANRQAVVRWVREVRKPVPPPLSPYLQRAAVFSDEAGSEIIMALDLDGAMSFERVGRYLKSKQKYLDKWDVKLTDLTALLGNVQGIRVGVRIGEQRSGKIAVDMRGDASAIASFAKPLLLMILADTGASINDFQSWTFQAKKGEISLAGQLSTGGLRRLLSVVDSPAGSGAVAGVSQVSPGDLPAMQLKATQDHFRAVTGMFNDVREDMKNAKNLASTSFWFDKYARRIERLPILNVDDELLKYSAFVAAQMRQASLAVKTMGIQSGVRQAEITGADVSPYAVGTTRWGRYGWYGGYGGAAGWAVKDAMAEVKEVGAERRVVRAEEKATMATDVQQIRQAVIAATADIRRKMTQKYQVEF